MFSSGMVFASRVFRKGFICSSIGGEWRVYNAVFEDLQRSRDHEMYFKNILDGYLMVKTPNLEKEFEITGETINLIQALPLASGLFLSVSSTHYQILHPGKVHLTYFASYCYTQM